MTEPPRRRSLPLLLVAVGLWVGLAGEAAAQGSIATDRAVLEVLYDATDGASWKDSRNWKTGAPLGEWHGVTTDAAGRVTALSLYYNGLTGSIPRELGSLQNLKLLRLNGNALTGPIPRELGSLQNLELLFLDDNELTGPVPAWLGELVHLRELFVGGNALSGPIPDELKRLENLERLDLSYNWGLTGPLPRGPWPSRLVELDVLVTQACVPSAWRDQLATTEFYGRPCGAGTDVTIDIVVVYTPAVRAAMGGIAAVAAEIDLMVAETNEAYAASGVHHRLELVERSEMVYPESGDVFVDIDRLRDPADGHLDEVHALRDRRGADLVHLMVSESRFAGVGDLNGPFSVGVHRGGGVGGAILFAHELGHNMGLLHDRYTTHRNRRGRAHPAYGYVNQRALEAGAGRSSHWVTTMAYQNQCENAGTRFYCSSLLRFSNPRQSYNGDPLGIPYGSGETGVTGPADAVAVLNTTGPAMATWRDRPARANRPPAVVGTLPNRTLAPDSTVTLEVSRAFVDPDSDPLTYTASSSAPDVVNVRAAGVRLTLTAVGRGRATVRVTATDPGGLSATQAFTVTVAAMRAPFTDDPIVPRVTPIKAVHFTELRTRIDALRTAAGLLRFSWTDPVLRAGVTRVRRVHLLELRAALAEAYRAAGRAVPRWTDASPVAGSTPIRAAHVTELRAAVLMLE